MSNSPQTAAGHVLAAYATAGGFRGYMDASKNAHSFLPQSRFSTLAPQYLIRKSKSKSIKSLSPNLSP